VTWGAYLPGIAGTVVNCNQNCNHGPGAGVVRHRKRSGLWGGREAWASSGPGLREAADSCLRVVAALDGPLLVRSAHREAPRRIPAAQPAVPPGDAGTKAAGP
jgi:hypothetical protein